MPTRNRSRPAEQATAAPAAPVANPTVTPEVVPSPKVKRQVARFVVRLNAVRTSHEKRLTAVMADVMGAAFATPADALDPERNGNEVWRELRREAGRSLNVSGDDLTTALRIVAYDALLRSPFADLKYEVRRKLLPLAEHALMREGARHAKKAKLGPTATGVWVRKKLGVVGRRTAARRVTERGVGQVIGSSKIKFVEVEPKRKVVDILRRMAPKKKEAALKDLRDIARGIESILMELEDF